MTLVDPAQAKVATTVLPKGGFSGLNSLLSSVPLVPLNPHRAIPDAVAAAVNPGTAVPWLGGVTWSEQPATSRAMTSSRLDVVRPPCGKDATWRMARHSVGAAAAVMQKAKFAPRCAVSRSPRSVGVRGATVYARCHGRCGGVPQRCRFANRGAARRAKRGCDGDAGDDHVGHDHGGGVDGDAVGGPKTGGQPLNPPQRYPLLGEVRGDEHRRREPTDRVGHHPPTLHPCRCATSRSSVQWARALDRRGAGAVAAAGRTGQGAPATSGTEYTGARAWTCLKSNSCARLFAVASRTVSGSRPQRHSIIRSTEVWSYRTCDVCWRRAKGETSSVGVRKPRRPSAFPAA